MDIIIKTIAPKKLIGKRIQTILLGNETPLLWKSFMPRRKEISNNLSDEFFSVQVYDSSLEASDFRPDTPVEKWATMEVPDFDAVPDGMETFTLTGGLYATFIYTGTPETFADTFHYIYGTWLPASEFKLDNSRPHFEILGEKYRRNDPSSEEEVWIPVKVK